MQKELLLIASILLSIQSFAQEQLLIQLKENVNVEDFKKSHSFDMTYERTLFRAINLHLFQTNEKIAIASIAQHYMVKQVETEQAIEERTTPNDPDFGTQWALERIGAPKAWDITTGGTTTRGDRIVVAVLESGFEVNHEDLVGNLWINPHEVAGNGLDDDGNGYIDDIHGWNVRGNRNEFDSNFHGQSVTGIIGQEGDNGLGGAGINWDVDLMLMQYRTVPDIFEAYDYVYEMRRLYNESNGAQGAFVVVTNASWGLSDIVPCPESSMWYDAYEQLGEVGILTAASVKNSPINIDEVGDTPSGCPSEFLISIMNTDRFEEKASVSAFGLQSVDLAAPGVDIFTTGVNNSYNPSFDGASSAAPHVAGAVALLYSMPFEQIAIDALNKPSETAKLIRKVILDGAERLPTLTGLNATGARLSVYNSMLELQAYINPVSGNALEIYSAYPNPANNIITIEYEAKGFDNMRLHVYDAIGRVVIKDIITPCCQEINRFGIDVSKLESGNYFVELEQNDAHKVIPFFKD